MMAFIPALSVRSPLPLFSLRRTSMSPAKKSLSVTGSSARKHANVSHYKQVTCTMRKSSSQPLPTMNHDDEHTLSDNAWMTMPVEKQLLTLTASILGFSVLLPSASIAAIPEGLKEGFKSIPASLVHPAVMWLAVAGTLYTFWLGYQSSRIRQVDPETRKELIKARFTDRHFQTSSSLFALVSLATFGGMANTYNRAGKLFPGPHLYAGLGIVALMSVMTAFVPYMQKGKDWARNSHFATAFLVTGFFLWQAKSGMNIVFKLLKWS